MVRESTEDDYSVLENRLYPGVVEFLKIMTKSKSYIFAEYAFDFVMKSNKELVTAIHKSIFLKLGYGLVRQIAEDWSRLLWYCG